MVSPLDNSSNSPLPEGFTEYKNSAKESYDLENGTFEATRIFDGPWTNRKTFIEEHLTGIAFSAEGETYHGEAHAYPPYEEAKAYRVDVQGLLKTDIDDDDFIKHQIARLTVSYKIFPGQEQPGNEENKIEESIKSSTKIIPIPGRNFTSPGDGSVVGEEFTIPLIEVYLDYEIKLPLNINPLWSNIAGLLGYINSVPITFPSGLTAGTETLLYNGLSGSTKYQLPTKEVAWQLNLHFTYFGRGWNKYPKAVEGQNFVQYLDITPKIYEAFDLRPLIDLTT